MVKIVALLRSINVGGRGRLPMADLRRIAETAGCTGVTTVLQSGNLVCDAGARDHRATKQALESALRDAGMATTVVVRDRAALDALLAEQPFPAAARDDPAHLVVVFLDASPAPEAVEALRARITGREQIAPAGGDLVVAYPDGIGDSKLTAALIDRTLGVTGTARNWNTVQKLHAALGTP